MKKIPQRPSQHPQNPPDKHPSPFFLALVLTGILALEINPVLIDRANANNEMLRTPHPHWDDKGEQQRQGFRALLLAPQTDSPRTILTTAIARSSLAPEAVVQGNQNRSQQLPPSVVAAVRQEIFRQTKISPQQLRIIQFSRQSWPNTCLGLAKAGELCGQMIVDGWRVVVSDGRQTWIYRTDAQGKVLRMENLMSSAKLPEAVVNAVMRDASQQSGLAVSSLRVVEAKRQTWPDGCLGLGGAGVICTQALVPGWQVTVGSQERRWVYRTNDTASVVMMEPTASSASEAGNFQAEKIPVGELPPPLTTGMVFRAIVSGGIAGRTYETVLMEDGRLMRVLMGPENANDSGRQVFQVSPQEVQEFQDLLGRLKLARFNQFSFPAPRGAADFITVTLTSAAGTIRYADVVSDRLPQPLQEAIQAWGNLTRVIR
ncbi:MAG: hypothetical protein ACM37W_06060 [Actinomycetota bacterium]